MAFEQVPNQITPEAETQDPGQRWLADVRLVPGYSSRDEYIIETIQKHLEAPFVHQQKYRQRVLESEGIDVIADQLEAMRRVVRGDLIA